MCVHKGLAFVHVLAYSLLALQLCVSIKVCVVRSSCCSVLWSAVLQSSEPSFLFFSWRYVMAALFMFTFFLLQKWKKATNRERTEKKGGGEGHRMRHAEEKITRKRCREEDPRMEIIKEKQSNTARKEQWAMEWFEEGDGALQEGMKNEKEIGGANLLWESR